MTAATQTETPIKVANKPVGEPPPPTPGAAIEVQNIVKVYGSFMAVKGVSFQVQEGEIFGLLGPNGAGKSTLIRMMTTLIPVSGGRALVAGYDVSKDSDAVRRVIGVIPQALTSEALRCAAG
jgi:ABC-2 type transport system ATP-binding protein